MSIKQQGNIGESFAIFYYTKIGYIVSKPLYENTPYDLIADNGNKLLRIQVKTSNYRPNPGGGFAVALRNTGGNQSGKGKITRISSEKIDLVFILCSDGSYYEIPADICDGRTTITVSQKSEFYLGKTPM